MNLENQATKRRYIRLWACFIGIGSTPAVLAQAPEIFEPITVDTRPVSIKPYVIQSRPVIVHLDPLSAAVPSDTFTLNMFPFISYIGVVERVDRRSDSQFTVAGHLAGSGFGTFTIVVEGEAAVGIVRDPTAGLLYKLGYAGEGMHILSEFDIAAYPPCGNGMVPPPIPTQPVSTNALPIENETIEDATSSAPAPGGVANTCTTPEAVFDMLIVYSDIARQAAGGTNAMNAECQRSIEVANEAYLNSGIHARIRLVYRGEIAYDENGSLNNHLDRLTGTTDGFMDEVHALRDAYSADVVSLFVDNADGWCGLAHCLPNTAARAFSVVRWDCASSNLSLAHEVGHNQGCAHDRDNAGEGCSAYADSFGWRFMGNSFETFRTVMAYSPGTRLPYFSNPNVEFDGVPTGVPAGDPDQARNAQTINIRRLIVEDHRLTRFDIWVDFAHVGAETGAFSQPYNTVAEGAAYVIQGVGASEYPSLWIKAGSTGETVSIDTPMFIRSCGGLVTIGNSPDRYNDGTQGRHRVSQVFRRTLLRTSPFLARFRELPIHTLAGPFASNLTCSQPPQLLVDGVQETIGHVLVPA